MKPTKGFMCVSLKTIRNAAYPFRKSGRTTTLSKQVEQVIRWLFPGVFIEKSPLKITFQWWV